MTERDRGMQNAEDPLAAYGRGLSNAAADPEWMHRQNRMMFEEAAKMREYAKRQSIHEIRQQPFFGRLYD